MSLIPENVERLVPYTAGKPIEELERELGIKNAVKLASNENPLGPSPRGVEAARAAILGVNRYNPGGSTPGPTPPPAADRFNVFPNPAFMSSAGVVLRTGDLTGSFTGRVFDIKGRVVRHLLGNATTGTLWDAKDELGIPVRPGLYIMEVKQGSTVRTGRVFLFR